MEPYWTAAQFLAADADRERAIAALNQHFQAGRITVDELSDRIGRALAARTYGDVDAVMIGLPWQPASIPVYPPAPSFYAPPGRGAKGMGITAFVLGVFGFLCGITAVPAVLLGLMALTVDADRREDKGFAIAGLAVGAMWMLIFGWLFFR